MSPGPRVKKRPETRKNTRKDAPSHHFSSGLTPPVLKPSNGSPVPGRRLTQIGRRRSHSRDSLWFSQRHLVPSTELKGGSLFDSLKPFGCRRACRSRYSVGRQVMYREPWVDGWRWKKKKQLTRTIRHSQLEPCLLRRSLSLAPQQRFTSRTGQSNRHSFSRTAYDLPRESRLSA